jgi:glutathione peroxidase
MCACGGGGMGGKVAILVAVATAVTIAVAGGGNTSTGNSKDSGKHLDKNPPTMSPTPAPGTPDGGQKGKNAGTGNSAKDNAKDKKDGGTMATPGNDAAYVLGYVMNRIDGTSETLDAYKGKVVLMVNVASQCGYTKQYTGLEKLYHEKMGEGFVILGFPANNFRGQEPGTNEEIAKFCSSKYNVTFPMFEKISVKGADAHPLYQQLAGAGGGEPQWNFTKYLVGRDGKVVAKFDSDVKPDDAALTAKIDELLSAK